MNSLQYQIILLKSSIKFTTRQMFHLQGLSAPHDAVRDCLRQLRKYESELRTKEKMMAMGAI